MFFNEMQVVPCGLLLPHSLSPQLCPYPLPRPPTLLSLSGVSVYGNQRPPHLYTLKGKKHLWLGEKEEKKKKREREEKLAWLWKMTLEVAKPAARVESIVS